MLWSKSDVGICRDLHDSQEQDLHETIRAVVESGSGVISESGSSEECRNKETRRRCSILFSTLFVTFSCCLHVLLFTANEL